MKMIAPRYLNITIIALSLLVASCDSMRGILGGDSAEPQSSALSDANSDVRFLALSKQAQSKAQKTPQAKGKIRYYFDAARFAWASKAPGALDQVILSADAGQRECSSIPTGQQIPARDCAVLAALEPVAVGQSVLDKIEGARGIISGAEIDQATWTEIEIQMKKFDQIVAKDWIEVAKEMQQPAVDVSIRNWFRDIRATQWCRVLLNFNVKRWIATDGERKQARKKAVLARNSIRKNGAPQFDLSGEITATSGQARIDFCSTYTNSVRREPPAT